MYWIDPIGLEAIPGPYGIPIPIIPPSTGNGGINLNDPLLPNIPDFHLECVGRWCFPVHNEDGSDAENSDSSPKQCPNNDSASDKNIKKPKVNWPPYDGPKDGYIEGPRRDREYNEEGRPKRDYDKPHQGADYPHVHEWENGVREEPGRPYSPIN